jgi:hypothetical protein
LTGPINFFVQVQTTQILRAKDEPPVDWTHFLGPKTAPVAFFVFADPTISNVTPRFVGVASRPSP